MTEFPTIGDVEAAVSDTQNLIKAAAAGDASQKDLDKSAERESEVIQGYVEGAHTQAQDEAQAEAGE